MVDINSAEENDFLAANMVGVDHFWIGLRTLEDRREFRWVHTGKRFILATKKKWTKASWLAAPLTKVGHVV